MGGKPSAAVNGSLLLTLNDEAWHACNRLIMHGLERRIGISVPADNQLLSSTRTCAAS